MPTPTVAPRRRAVDDAGPRLPAEPRARRTPPSAPTSPSGCSRSWSAGATTSSTAGSPWSGRTATSSCSRWAGDAAAGPGLRQPRRVVVVRARAAARVVRPAAGRRRRPGPDPRRRLRRARLRAARPAGRAGRRGRAGAGHRGGRRRRAREARPACATRWPEVTYAVTTDTARPSRLSRAADGREPERSDDGLDLARTLARATARSTPGRKKAVRRIDRSARTGRVSGAHPDDRDPQTARHRADPDGRRPRVAGRPQGRLDVRPLVRTRRARDRRAQQGRVVRRRPPRGAHRLDRVGDPAQAARAHRRTPAQRGSRARHGGGDRGARPRMRRRGSTGPAPSAAAAAPATPTADAARRRGTGTLPREMPI